jgi:tetratricopeptide (TPR) repeat protein
MPTKKSLQMPNQPKEEALMRIQQEIRIHHKHGNYSDALKASKQLLTETTEHFGKDHPATASAYNNVGLMNKQMGDFDESRKHYHESLRIYGRVVGKDHASYAAALHNIGSLNKTQVHVDETLTGIQRLQLNEEALEYLQDAWRIRQVELGDEHPHTISSRSNYGSTLAAQVIQTTAKAGGGKSVPKLSKLTIQRWEAAEDHLRQALKTAVDNPRGDTIAAAAAGTNQDRITTLSAASAAQNLAVVLKTRGTEVVPEDDAPSRVLDNDAVAEAKQLYEQALKVRAELLHEAHPDVVATKFSLAEVLASLGDKDGANLLREEIMETYGVQELDEAPEDESKDKKA